MYVVSITFNSYKYSNMAQNEALLQQISASNADFSHNFYKVLQEHEGNLLASPLSAQLVLALAQLGACGKTAEEMKNGLCLPDDSETVKNGFQALMTTLQDVEKGSLEIANRMYVKVDFGVKEKFSDAAEKMFNSSVECVNFKNPEVHKGINEWVEKTTHDKIKNLIPEGLLTELTRLVLINAIYFKGLWKEPFQKGLTKPGPFYLDETMRSVVVPFMNKQKCFNYIDSNELGAEVVELKYGDGQLSLLIVLPKSPMGLAAVETKMRMTKLSNLVHNMRSLKIDLYLPKFKLEVSLRLNEYLQKMGMNSMFEGSADFSGISQAELQVSHVLQKNFIEISEEGIKLPPRDMHVMRFGPCGPPIIVMANCPFLFYLMSRREVVLLAGRLMNPLAD